MSDAASFRPAAAVPFPAVLVGGVLLVLAAIDPALHALGVVAGHDPWLAWPLTPDITGSVLLTGWLYIAGQRQSARLEDGWSTTLRQFAFFGGLAALFLALQSPIETISDHQFLMHQVEHMLLRTTAPLLLVLAAPQAALLRGLPGWARRWIIRPLFASRVVRPLGVLGHPAIATMLFVGTTYFWMIPRFHDEAILDEPIHYLWHTTLLLSGLIFFWRLLDPRPRPLGASLGVRLFMFWVASIGNILLGSYLSFKHQVLYSAYAQMGRLWAIAPASDENIGGLIMWIPGSMMFVGTAMLMIYRWAQQEERSFARQRGAPRPIAAAQFVSQRRSANRKMAVGLVCFMLTVAAITFTTVFIYHYAGNAGERARF
ncbi:MAG TPA: cytochrome c oxidase assembly protein [Stellaceae bacterium]|nr:cytochrome c oxidase assembly protein [Stellaceae bacterium]